MTPQWLIVAGLILAAWGVLGSILDAWLKVNALWPPVCSVIGCAGVVVGALALWLADRTGWDTEAAVAAVVLAWCVVSIGGVGLLCSVGALASKVSDRRRKARQQ